MLESRFTELYVNVHVKHKKLYHKNEFGVYPKERWLGGNNLIHHQPEKAPAGRAAGAEKNFWGSLLEQTSEKNPKLTYNNGVRRTEYEDYAELYYQEIPGYKKECRTGLCKQVPPDFFRPRCPPRWGVCGFCGSN